MLFTIFTPIYNRAHTIHRVWDSLQTQTFRDFEWLCVDDGSSDNIGEILEQYKKEADFPVTILVQPQNRGKHMAWNRAAEAAKGELFVVADSDDAFLPQTLQRFSEVWDELGDDRDHFSGVNCLCQNDKSGQIVGDHYPANPFDSNSLEMNFIHNITGEKWGCVRTDLIRRFPFPDVPGTHFAENYVWYGLARDYQIRCINEPLRIFFEAEDVGRLSHEKKVAIPESRYLAMYLWNKLHLNMNGDFMLRKPKELIVTIANMGRTGKVIKKGLFQGMGDLSRGWVKLLFLMLYPLSFYLFLRDNRRGRIGWGR